MPDLGKQSLYEVIKDKTLQLSFTKLDIMCEISNQMTELHHRTMHDHSPQEAVHKDIKEENIQVKRKYGIEIPTIIDMGLSKQFSNNSSRLIQKI